VADELPDTFIEELHRVVKEEKKDAVVIGEVWEDASNKIAYDVRRRYLLGRELDGVMNYPLRDSLLAYILGGDAALFKNNLETLREHYPRDIFYSLMNSLGNNDTPRILTVLGALPEEWNKSKEERAGIFLPPERLDLAKKRLKLAAAVLFTFPGSPCVFYGDEAGMEGFEDPFNRRGYPWGKEDKDLIHHFTLLGKTRNESESLQSGDINYLHAEGGILVYERVAEGSKNVLVCVNRGETDEVISAQGYKSVMTDIFTKEKSRPVKERLKISMPPMSVKILV
jgi:glycosidase